ncbi:hypothetical protein LEMLEM_LOCUS23152 [Lemmus lemmus]
MRRSPLLPPWKICRC